MTLSKKIMDFGLNILSKILFSVLSDHTMFCHEMKYEKLYYFYMI